MRLRICTLPMADDRMPRGAHLAVYVVEGEDDEHGPTTTTRLEGVQAVTLHCGARDEPVIAVLTIAGVRLDLDLPLPVAAQAALRLINDAG